MVINSLHKTLPSLTQTAILHINGKLANRRRIKKYLDMLQSSSPSYIFMASLDACVDFLDGKCEEAFELYVERLQSSEKSWNYCSIYRFSVQNIMIFPKL